jgi:hypothetical protein
LTPRARIAVDHRVAERRSAARGADRPRSSRNRTFAAGDPVSRSRAFSTVKETHGRRSCRIGSASSAGISERGSSSPPIGFTVAAAASTWSRTRPRRRLRRRLRWSPRGERRRRSAPSGPAASTRRARAGERGDPCRPPASPIDRGTPGRETSIRKRMTAHADARRTAGVPAGRSSRSGWSESVSRSCGRSRLRPTGGRRALGQKLGRCVAEVRSPHHAASAAGDDEAAGRRLVHRQSVRRAADRCRRHSAVIPQPTNRTILPD